MSLDLNQIFPIKDVPSARLAKLKAFCLFRAGVVSEQEMAMIQARADACIEAERFHETHPPRRAA
jgi:hypothetical protein